MRNFFIWIWRGALAVLMFISGVGPNDAQSNISGWLELANLQRAAEITADWTVHPSLIWACALLIAVSFIPNALQALPAGLRLPERKAKPNPTAVLASGAGDIISRIRHLRDNRPLSYAASQEVIDTAQAGIICLRKFGSQGYIVPALNSDSAEKVCMGVHAYLMRLRPMLLAGEDDIAKAQSGHVAQHAQSVCDDFNPGEFYVC